MEGPVVSGASLTNVRKPPADDVVKALKKVMTAGQSYPVKKQAMMEALIDLAQEKRVSLVFFTAPFTGEATVKQVLRPVFFPVAQRFHQGNHDPARKRPVLFVHVLLDKWAPWPKGDTAARETVIMDACDWIKEKLPTNGWRFRTEPEVMFNMVFISHGDGTWSAEPLPPADWGMVKTSGKPASLIAHLTRLVSKSDPDDRTLIPVSLADVKASWRKLGLQDTDIPLGCDELAGVEEAQFEDAPAPTSQEDHADVSAKRFYAQAEALRRLNIPAALKRELPAGVKAVVLAPLTEEPLIFGAVPVFQGFWRPHRLAESVLCAALTDPKLASCVLVVPHDLLHLDHIPEVCGFHVETQKSYTYADVALLFDELRGGPPVASPPMSLGGSAAKSLPPSWHSVLADIYARTNEKTLSPSPSPSTPTKKKKKLSPGRKMRKAQARKLKRNSAAVWVKRVSGSEPFADQVARLLPAIALARTQASSLDWTSLPFDLSGYDRTVLTVASSANPYVMVQHQQSPGMMCPGAMRAMLGSYYACPELGSNVTRSIARGFRAALGFMISRHLTTNPYRYLFFPELQVDELPAALAYVARCTPDLQVLYHVFGSAVRVYPESRLRPAEPELQTSANDVRPAETSVTKGVWASGALVQAARNVAWPVDKGAVLDWYPYVPPPAWTRWADSAPNPIAMHDIIPVKDRLTFHMKANPVAEPGTVQHEFPSCTFPYRMLLAQKQFLDDTMHAVTDAVLALYFATTRCEIEYEADDNDRAAHALYCLIAGDSPTAADVLFVVKPPQLALDATFRPALEFLKRYERRLKVLNKALGAWSEWRSVIEKFRAGTDSPPLQVVLAADANEATPQGFANMSTFPAEFQTDKPYIVYGRRSCPFTRRVLSVLEPANLCSFTELAAEKAPRDALPEFVKWCVPDDHATVPIVLTKGYKFIGGCTEFLRHFEGSALRKKNETATTTVPTPVPSPPP